MQQIGRFEVTGEVGRGGEGIVYSAYDPTIDRKVAIKALLIGGTEKEQAGLRVRLRHEAKSSGKLSHPNIVTVHEFLELEHSAYLVMEFVEGANLAERMAEPTSEASIVQSLRQAAEALDYAHSEGVVHRDVKPANMIVTSKGVLKVTDFGIAKLLTDTIGGQTQTGFVRGTAHYMAPEQIEQKGISGLSDQFSLAVIAYEWLSGQKPFDGSSWTSLLYQILHVEPPPVKRGDESLDDGVTAVVRKALAKDPADRYLCCRDFVDALEDSLGIEDQDSTMMRTANPVRVPTAGRRRTATKEVPATAAAPVPPARSRRAVWIGIAVCGLIALGAMLWKTTGVAPLHTGAPASPAASSPAVSADSPGKPPEPKAVEPAVKTATKAPAQPPSKAAAKPEPSPAQAVQANPPAAPQAPPAAPSGADTPTGRYLGPPAGRFVWNGNLGAGQTLTITVGGAGNRPSAGSIDGRGIPYNLAVSVSVQPPEIRVIEQPSASAGHQLVLRNTSGSEVTSITVQWREDKE